MHFARLLVVSFLAVLPMRSAAQEAAQAPDSTAADSAVVVVRKPTIPIVPFFIEGIEDTFLTATLEVPEDRSQPGGRKISLHIVIVPALEKGSGLPPLFDIAGGPGVSATAGAAEYAGVLRVHRERRPVVLVDQRGTGESNPLRCPELEAVSKMDDMYDPDAVARCRDELAKTADLSHYGTIDAVRDLEDVRNALAYDQIDFIGLSYGTQVVQMYMREYPDNVRAAVMLGAVPLGEEIPLHHANNAEAVLQRILDDCDSDPDCGRAYPSLRREWSELLERLDAGPVFAEFVDSTGARSVEIRKGPFCEALRSLLYVPPTQRLIPLLIHHAAQDDFRPFLQMVLAGGAGGSIAEGMYLCTICPEGTTRIAPDAIDAATARTFLGRWRVDQQMGACAVWALAPAPDADLAPVVAEAPTLFITGGMDAVTPIAWAQEISSRLTHSLVLVIDHLGHHPDGLEHMECYDAVIAQFFEKGSVVDLDTSCFDTMLPPPFVTE
ncbi:MAG: alpha/beta hydrolase [Candidatus Krumholzibacteria bacterium]|nr:alpha/beta hydrolase [Candidatus Krumholzibacteria bacterium]MDH4337493.1 alpha/beta hydrolase [Candidatus Krumholzibacteria bacterium]MDH5268308.1 alpha/beta hydrolase [Candidatus Krumholzibacteria bacterium]MDH5627701.1 alpha/beta hydrolase [Candidatus Krumholzibacteria bacterium]